MTCHQLHVFLDDYLGGGLSVAVRARFETHLADCPPCRAYLDTYTRTITLTRDALKPGSEDPPAEMPEELIRAIVRARRRPPRGGPERGA